MASSRWKRFAFFDRSALNLPSDVLEDLLPVSVSSASGGSTATRSIRSLSETAVAAVPPSSDCNVVSLAVTSAALPFHPRSKSNPSTSVSSSGSSSKQHQNGAAVDGFWSTLSACHPIEPLDGTTTTAAVAATTPSLTTKTGVGVIRLPNQAQNYTSNRNSNEKNGLQQDNDTAVDGLVLAFVASPETNKIHCVDITVRCTPSSTIGLNSRSKENIEDLDGWRGYIVPFAALPPLTTNEQRIVAEHTASTTPGGEEGYVAVAVCRDTTGHRPVHLACVSQSSIIVCVDPHLHLSCQRPFSVPSSTDLSVFSLLPSHWNRSNNGNITAVDIVPGIVAVGSDTGRAYIYTYGGGRQHLLKQFLAIPPPPSHDMTVVACKISLGVDKCSLFVAYRRKLLGGPHCGQVGAQELSLASKTAQQSNSTRTAAGVSCYDMPIPRYSSTPIAAPSARHDLDGRNVLSSGLCDAVTVQVDKDDVDNATETLFTVARPDGLYTYNATQKTDVSPIDGSKLAICLLPPPAQNTNRQLGRGKSGSRFVCVASTDSRSHRDAVDIYDSTNKLVAFHLLLSPGHKAVCAAGVASKTSRTADGTLLGGRSSAVVFTSGGCLVTMTEKGTAEKVDLLVQKNLYSAAILVAYGDPFYELEDIAMLYRRHAEHLYRQADYAGAIEQYKKTWGYLEPSHVIFRYLDAPKIPLLVSYLEELRSRQVATNVQLELLRTCYLKLGDNESAESIAIFSSRSVDTDSLSISNLVSASPKDALATICSLPASAAAEALVVYGASLAKLLPRETAGLAVSLCLGSFSPRRLSENSSATIMADTKKLLEHPTDAADQLCEPYPVHLFAPAFLENPKMLRLILSTCNRNKCPLTPSLRRTLLELTLADWNSAKRNGDTETEKLRQREAIAALTDSHCDEVGVYDALVIVQLAGFAEGEMLLYERMQMSPMLLSSYAKDGSEKARRKMLQLAQTEPELLAEVLGYFVGMVSDRYEVINNTNDSDESDDEIEDILSDLGEALMLVRRQGFLPPVRVLRVLAGEGTGQFSTTPEYRDYSKRLNVPLSVALEYVGDALDESRRECRRLRLEVEEYNSMCNAMEAEIEALLKTSSTGHAGEENVDGVSSRINVEKTLQKTKLFDDGRRSNKVEHSREAFWREMDQSEDGFETIARFFSKGVIP